jgi:hypothetical protein
MLIFGAFTVVEIRSIHCGGESQFGSVGRVYPQQSQELLRLNWHEWLKQDSGDAQRFTDVIDDAVRAARIVPWFCLVEILLGLQIQN